MLEVKDLKCFYGHIQALKGVSLQVNEGEVVSLIGANGAGKTTTLRSISGLVPATSGSIKFEGTEIANLLPSRIVAMGIAQVPEGRQVFPELSVEDNLILGGFTVTDKQVVRKRIDEIFQRFPRLQERRTQLAGTLSGGEQQMVALGRALMSAPRLLLLDEPSMGLSPKLVGDVFQIIADISDHGTTVLLVEQNAHMALAISDRAYIIQNGAITASGPAAELAADEGVRKAYLGE